MEERNCAKCTNQEAWGCTAFRWRTPEPDELGDDRDNWVRPAYLPITLDDGTETYACPRQDLFYNPKPWGRLLMLYGMYNKGHLPDRGSVVDQSNVLIEAFRIFDDVNAEVDRSQAEESRRKQARQSSGPLAKHRGG